jgi:hypothetical protein
LELPRPVARFCRVPKQDQLPPGPLATGWLDVQLLNLGLVTMDELVARPKEEDEGPRRVYDEDRVWVLALAEKLRRLFDFELPGVRDLRTQAVWTAGELLQYGGNFNKYIGGKDLQKQEGIIFRHLLRLILLLGEFQQLSPPELDAAVWQGELQDLAARLTESCRAVDPASTDRTLEQASGESQEAETAEMPEEE